MLATRTFALPQFSSGALTALKWLGLALMTVDHAEAFLFGRAFDSQLGRLVVPLFGFVLGYNLARRTVTSATRIRWLVLLLGFGLLATPFHAALRGDLLPLNILFSLALAVAFVHLFHQGRELLGFVLLLVGGVYVEYAWFGALVPLAVWFAYREPSPVSACFVPAAVAFLFAANGTHTALLALPVIWLAAQHDPALPRLRWFFYVYYPAHLAGFVLFKHFGGFA